MEYIKVTRSSMPPIDEYIQEISPLWDSHWLTNMGEKHVEFQNQLISKLSLDNIELFTNGHMALEMTLQAMGLTGEVITTPYTFISTTHAIVRNNLTPVFCDINPLDFTIDVSKIESLITDKTSAIVPVHVYGNICDVHELERIAQKYKLKIIYDAAHAFYEEYEGVNIGNFGDASCFSFHATKVFNSIEGGATCYHDKELGKKLYQLKNFGIKNEDEIIGVGANAKLNEFCAAMGICNLRHIDEEINRRKVVYELYMDRLSDCKGIRCNTISSKTKSNYSYFPIVVDPIEYGYTRDELYGRLKNSGILARKYFYPICNMCECYCGKYQGDTPMSLDIGNRVLTLPLYSDLPKNTVETICDIIVRK